MPNYTKNHLILYGKKGVLKYFYERNRVSEEDSKYLNNKDEEEEEERPLSFNKCIPRKVQNIFEKYISENYVFNNSLQLSKESISWDLMSYIWGTKWDAIDSTVDISFFEENDEEEEGSINYTFTTAGCYPYNWLLTISKLFPNILFEITYSNEDDAYINTYIKEYKNGIITSEKSYNALEKSMNNYTISEVVDLIITYFIDENRYIPYYDEKSKKKSNMDWLTYCKLYIKTNSNNEDLDDDLFLDILCQIQDVMDTYGFHESIYTNKELCKAFADKIRSM